MGNFFGSGLYILLVIFLSVVSYIAYRIYTKRKNKAAGPNLSGEEIETAVIVAMVVDNITGKYHEIMDIPWATAKEIVGKFGTLGRLWDLDGKKVYALNKYQGDDGEAAYRPIILSNRITNDPTELHYNLKQPAIELVIDEALRDEEKPFMERWGVWLWWIAVMGFLGFMWSQS